MRADVFEPVQLIHSKDLPIWHSALPRCSTGGAWASSRLTTKARALIQSPIQQRDSRKTSSNRGICFKC